jgi:predicted DNA-binding antitoxin AbrB/MazE fold protein
MSRVRAIFEKGVFRPLEAVSLPENCEVVFEPQVVESHSDGKPFAGVYAVLAERYESGETDVAARHGEHQPRRWLTSTGTNGNPPVS